jgi:hypothetical protein
MGVQILCQFTPKRRKRRYWGKTGGLGACPAQESRIEEGHLILIPDHVHQEMTNKQVDQMQLKLASS